MIGTENLGIEKVKLIFFFIAFDVKYYFINFILNTFYKIRKFK